jgi:hypothetical protein
MLVSLFCFMSNFSKSGKFKIGSYVILFYVKPNYIKLYNWHLLKLDISFIPLFLNDTLVILCPMISGNF